MPLPEISILIDNACPLCRREGAFLQRLDRGRGRLGLIDISAPGFDPGSYGRSMDQLMGEIHGVRSDGVLVTGMEVFRRAWGAVGYGWALAPTAWPLVRPVADAAYRWFARRRLALTGRCTRESCSLEGR